MKRFLTTQTKRDIKEAFRSNAVFRVINAAYKKQEVEMTLCFAPEEIWVNCFMNFDKLLQYPDEMEELVGDMWSNTCRDLQDDAKECGRQFEKKELYTATSCIIYAVIACLMASDDWTLMRHTESLMQQIAECSDLDSIILPFDVHIGDDFIGYIQQYIKAGDYISQSLINPKQFADPINPVMSAKDRTKVKKEVTKRLAFMKGVMPDGETQILSAMDFKKMIEAVEYLIENNVVKKQDPKICTPLSVADLRYTFYRVYKNEGKCITRELWLDFLQETFQKMKDNRESISKHFSDKPTGYDKRYLGKKKP